MSFPFDLDPDERDPGGWATSLLHNAELVLGCLEIVQARSVTEVGAFMGELTRLLLRWADGAGATVTAIDPTPHADLEQLERERTDLRLVRETSIEALAHVPLTDAVILDGDHNYYTVSQELALIAGRATDAGRPLPLLLLHDVGWPHGRRDDYYVPQRIPAEHRQPLADGGLYPGVEGAVHGGIPCDHPAAIEGGAGNGVLTAVEDFLRDRERLQVAIVPAFYGLGVIWDTRGPHHPALAQMLEPWDRNPVLERLEHNRVLHLANTHVQLVGTRDAQARIDRRDQLLAQRRELLGRMDRSRAFAAVEWYLRLRRGEPAFTREQIRGALR
jgi:Methyltransferase domain